MAASAVKIAANRANATRSTGPVDTSKTRFNGLAHGLTSKQAVIPGESHEEYERFSTTLRKDLKPGTALEKVLVDRVIAAAWRLQRFTRVESAFLTNRIDAYLEANSESDPDAAMANLFIDPAESARMRLFLRYQNSVQREYDKAFKEFQAAKKERRKRQMQTLALESYESAAPEVEAPIGFVSQEPAKPYVPDIGFASQPDAAAA
jgi:hypothetical protein